MSVNYKGLTESAYC